MDGESAPLLQLELELEQNHDAPSAARAAINDLAVEIDADRSVVATLALLVSEVVTNAIRHPRVNVASPINLRASVRGRSIRVEVTDQGAGFTPKQLSPGVHGGYGLMLLHRRAERWGVDARHGNTVWFELAT